MSPSIVVKMIHRSLTPIEWLIQPIPIDFDQLYHANQYDRYWADESVLMKHYWSISMTVKAVHVRLNLHFLAISIYLCH